MSTGAVGIKNPATSFEVDPVANSLLEKYCKEFLSQPGRSSWCLLRISSRAKVTGAFWGRVGCNSKARKIKKAALWDQFEVECG